MNETDNLILRLNLDLLIGNCLDKQIFSACSLGFFKSEKGKICRQIYNYGRTGVGFEKELVCENTIFDLASLTKPLATSLIILYLVDKGCMSLNDNLNRYFNFIRSDKYPIKINHLLSHTSGLPAHKPYFLELIQIPFESRRKYIEEKILSEKLCFYPGEKSLYSDLGFILLGFIIERVTGEKLDTVWKKTILKPMGIEREKLFFNNTNSDRNLFVETGICPWSKKSLRGIVNDDNCRALGGVAGHAGLFGTTSGLLSFVENIMFEIKGVTNIFKLKKETTNSFFKRKKESSWVNGFDTPSVNNSSSGDHFSELTFGHLGFTGTSFWIDIKMECGVVLLTNRVLCCEDLGPIRKMRPLVHNLIMDYINLK